MKLMMFVKRALALIVVIGALCLGVLLAIQNTIAVPLDLLFVVLPERSVSLWLFTALALGVALGILVSWVAVLNLRKERFLLRSKLQKAQKELDVLRTSAVKK